MRARSELETSFGSLFVLDERARPSVFTGGGAPSAPGGPPEAGSSVWMKQHLFPYGQEPETQNVYDNAEVSNSICGRLRMGTRTLQISVLYCVGGIKARTSATMTLVCNAGKRYEPWDAAELSAAPLHHGRTGTWLRTGSFPSPPSSCTAQSCTTQACGC